MTAHAATKLVDVKAWIEEIERIRLMRAQRHFIVAVVAGIALPFVMAMTDSLIEAVLIPILVAVSLQSLARGANAILGHLWGWIYPEPTRTTRLDRVAGTLMGRLRVARREPQVEDVRVRVLDPTDS